MVRSVEKLLKIERPTKLSEMKLETLEAFPTLPKLDLTNIETCTEPALAVHIDLGLDQLEEPEE